MSTKDLFDNEAQLDDEEEDEDFDEETGEARKGLSKANGDLNDSSEEEDDEDDEDAAREVSPRNLNPFVRRPLTRT
jgi:transcription elongation factor SPT6